MWSLSGHPSLLGTAMLRKEDVKTWSGNKTRPPGLGRVVCPSLWLLAAVGPPSLSTVP